MKSAAFLIRILLAILKHSFISYQLFLAKIYFNEKNIMNIFSFIMELHWFWIQQIETLTEYFLNSTSVYIIHHCLNCFELNSNYLFMCLDSSLDAFRIFFLPSFLFLEDKNLPLNTSYVNCKHSRIQRSVNHFRQQKWKWGYSKQNKLEIFFSFCFSSPKILKICVTGCTIYMPKRTKC